MKFNSNQTTQYVRGQLERVPLFAKLSFMIFLAILFFPLFFFINETQLVGYSCFLLSLFIIMTILARLIIGQKSFWATIKLWTIGSIIYLFFAIPYTLAGLTLCPSLVLCEDVSRWLFVLGLPLRLLAIFFVGLTFIEITSPVEFLRFGIPGLYLAFLFRIIGYTKRALWETIDALRMQGKWPEEGKAIIRFREAWLKIKHAPMLASVTFRNIICWFLPWAWLSFNIMHKNLKGD